MSTVLRRLAPALSALLLALLSLLAAASPAHAAEDEVRALEVSYDVQSDGSVVVRHELQWRFAETGRRGIEFAIATREPWDQDPMMDVVHEVSELEVDSPSGAPDEFQRTDHQSGSRGEIQLRIGDPDVTLDTRDATYVISYRLRGAMRTFDGVPELHWDVSSGDYPRINSFSVTITGPDGVDRARCLAGSEECAQSVTDGVATLSGSDVAPGEAITAVAGFPAGSVANAEPILVERDLSAPTVVDQSSHFVVDSDGGLHAEHTISYRFPADAAEPRTFMFAFPTRLPHGFTRDQVFTISNLSATDGSGTELPTRSSFPTDGDSSRLEGIANVTVTPVDRAATLVLSYDVTGAAGVVDGSQEATFRWPVTHADLNNASDAVATWEFPGTVLQVSCTKLSRTGRSNDNCSLRDLHSVDDGVRVSLPTGQLDPARDTYFLEVQLPDGAVGGTSLQLEPSRDLASLGGLAAGAGGGLAGFIALVLGVGGAGGLMQRRDHRFVGVPPGLTVAGGATGPTSRDAMVPVRFHPPEVDLAKAGIVLDGTYNARHTAAALTQLAVDGAIGIETTPLRLVRGDVSRSNSTVGHAVYTALPRTTGKRMSSEQLRKVNRAVDRVQKDVLGDRSLFRAVTGGCGIRLWFMFVFLLLVPAVLVWLALFGPWDLSLPVALVLAGAAGGSAIGCFVGLVRSGLRTPLTAEGTALRDQIRGFEQYIATAEAEQLDFEADQDIFRRYLPWAVLFDLTERWTKVCEELAGAGLVPPLDTSFAGGVPASRLKRELNSLQARSRSAGLTTPSSGSSGSSSRGGSGGSSGFSSRGGGSGGGGTRARSW